MSGGDEGKTVYAQFDTDGDNVSDVQTDDSIILDETQPSVSANNNSTTWRNSAVTITLSVSDENLSTAKYRWNNADCVG